MITLAEIEDATERLTVEEQHKLLAFVLERLSAKSNLIPHPRIFSKEQLDRWVQQDEAEMREFERTRDAGLSR